MKKFRAAVAAVLVTALALTGCSSNKKETEAPKETQAPVVEEASEAVSEAAAVAETEAAAAVEAAITEAEAAVETAATEAVEAAEAVETEAAPAVEAVMTEAEEAVAAVETEVAEAVEEVLTEAEEAAAVVETEAEAAAAVAETEAEATEVGNGVEVRACIASEPETLDPNLESSVDGATYAMHLFEGLMKYDMTDDNASDNNDNLKLIMPGYGQAESYEVSEDGLTYTFTLRDDIVWSDGQPVTAADFEYSWKRIVDPANAADYGYLLGGIVENAAAIQAGEAEPDTLGIKAIDDKTLEIKLEAECPYFLGICAFAALMPLRQDVIEEFGNEWTNPENMVTNGAYVLTDWQHDSYLEMTRSATYYGGGNGPSKITWYLSDSQTNQLASYQADEYDFFDDLPVDQIASLRESGDAFELGRGVLFLAELFEADRFRQQVSQLLVSPIPRELSGQSLSESRCTTGLPRIIRMQIWRPIPDAATLLYSWSKRQLLTVMTRMPPSIMSSTPLSPTRQSLRPSSLMLTPSLACRWL